MKLVIVKTCLLVLSHLIAQHDTTLATAGRLYTNKQYYESIAICTAQLQKLDIKDTLYEQFLLIRTGSYTALHQFRSSINDYLTLIRIKPNEMPYYVNLSYMYSEEKQMQDCLAVLEKAHKINPQDVVVLSNLSYFSGQVFKYDDAVKYANEGLKFDADSLMKSALTNNRGYGYIGLKRYAEALKDINAAIVFDPNNFYAYYYRSMVNIALKKFDTVCDDLEKAANLGGVGMTEDLRAKYCTVKKS